MVWAQEKILQTFFPYIFYGKTKRNSPQTRENKILCKIQKCPSLNASSIKNFGALPPEWGGGFGITKPTTH